MTDIENDDSYLQAQQEQEQQEYTIKRVPAKSVKVEEVYEALIFNSDRNIKMKNENMRFWRSVEKTDSNRVKPITGKPYQGHSPQPYYMVERMTEAFGMCGIGWGLNILSERMERLTETDILHIALVEVWYVHNDMRGTIKQIGQTKACYKTSSEKIIIDEDAPKKSVTDAMTKCMSYLGFAGDIFSGKWDDSKYVNQLKKEHNEVKQPKLSAEKLNNAIKMISDAKTMDELKYLYQEAYKQSEEHQKEALTVAKDNRKKELIQLEEDS